MKLGLKLKRKAPWVYAQRLQPTSREPPICPTPSRASVPTAQVVRLPNANHYVFNSNEAEVLRAMNGFLDQLP